jgi:hypothetical protein
MFHDVDRIPLGKGGRAKEVVVLQVIQKAYELLQYTITVLSSDKNFPKRFRHTLCDRIEDLSLEIYQKVYRANYTNLQERYSERRALQEDAITSAKAMSALLSISFENKYFSKINFEFWSGIIEDVVKLIFGWKRSDEERYKKSKNENNTNDSAQEVL